MALGLTQRLTKMSTRNISLGIKAVGAWGRQPSHLLLPKVLKSVSLKLLGSLGLPRLVLGLRYLNEQTWVNGVTTWHKNNSYCIPNNSAAMTFPAARVDWLLSWRRIWVYTIPLTVFLWSFRSDGSMHLRQWGSVATSSYQPSAS